MKTSKELCFTFFPVLYPSASLQNSCTGYAFPQSTSIQPMHRDTWLGGDIIDYSSDSISGFHQLQPLFKYNPKRGMIVYPPLSLSLWQKIQKKKYNYQFIWAPCWEYTVHLGSRCKVSVSSQDFSLCHELETGERMVRQLGWFIIPKTHHSVLSLSPGRTHLLEVHRFTSARVWVHGHEAVEGTSLPSHSSVQGGWISFSVYW